VKDGAQRMPGEGAPGRRGGPAGDLHVLLRINPHPFFRADAGRLTVEVPITFAEAALGGEIGVPVLGGAIRLKIPAGTQSGAMFRARGKGLPDTAGTRGDLHVRVEVETPVALDERAVAALLTFMAAVGDNMQPRRGAFDRAWHTGEKAGEAPQETRTDTKADGKPGT
jgi:molecular chaperone DnaJ